MIKMITKTGEKGAIFEHCNFCDYIASSKYKWDRHILTDKHQMIKMITKTGEKGQKGADDNKSNFFCECGKVYKHQSNLCRHKKTCIIHEKKISNISNNSKINNEISINDKDKSQTNECQMVDSDLNDISGVGVTKNILINLINQNKQLQDLIIKQSEEHQKQINELIPKLGNNNVINSNNKFNVQIFLNEKCKDAISLDKFINSIEISLSNLLISKNKGLVDGITTIFMENMNKLSLYERPVHCTDVKRETLYIKNDTWEKDEDKKIIKNAIKRISKKQSQNICKFKENKPNFMNNAQDKDEFIDVVKMITEPIEDKEDKVIKSICKNVYVNENILS